MVLLRGIRRPSGLSQEDLARQSGIRFVIVNGWESGHAKLSKLAKAQPDAFYKRLINRGALVLPQGFRP